ncbi:AMT1-1, partial [Symbiodinium pilosum]
SSCCSTSSRTSTMSALCATEFWPAWYPSQRGAEIWSVEVLCLLASLVRSSTKQPTCS